MNKRLHSSWIVAALGAGLAFAPIPSHAFVLDLFETVDNTATGTPSEIGPIVPLEPDGPGTPRFAGVVILMEGGDPSSPTDQQNRAFWSDALQITRTTVQMFSEGCTSGVVGDLSCFPNPFAVDHVFLAETSPFTTFTDDFGSATNTYQIHSDPPEKVPEPATLGLVGIGFAGLGLLRRRRP